MIVGSFLEYIVFESKPKEVVNQVVVEKEQSYHNYIFPAGGGLMLIAGALAIASDHYERKAHTAFEKFKEQNWK